MFGKARFFLLASAAALVLVSGAVDQSEAQNLNMTATIQSGCTIETKAVPFGDIDATSGGTAGPVTINVTNCAFSGSLANVTLDGGENVPGLNGLRQLKHATEADLIEYTLSESTNGAIAPGATFPATFDGIGGTVLQFNASIVSGAVTGKTTGDYADSVGITVSFALS